MNCLIDNVRRNKEVLLLHRSRLGAIAAPYLAPFLLLPLTSLIGDLFNEEELGKKDSIGKITVNAISGILTNIASSAIWETPSKIKSQQNEDLSRALANAHQRALEQFAREISEEDSDTLKEQANHILPLIKSRIGRALKTNTERSLIELFDVRRGDESSLQSVAGTFANRLTSERFILELSSESISTKQLLADEIELSLRRWMNEELTHQPRRITLGLSQNEGLPEPVRSSLLKMLAESIPHHLGQVVKDADYQNSWIAFQRSHLQAILHEVRNNQTLSNEDRELLRPLAEKLDSLAKS